MSPLSERERLFKRIDTLENTVQKLLQTVAKQNIELANINHRWATTFHEEPTAWIKKEDLVKILLSQGLLQHAQGRKRDDQRDYVRYFTDKIRRDGTFTPYEGEGKPPIGTAAWKQGTRILFHRHNAVTQFQEFYSIESL